MDPVSLAIFLLVAMVASYVQTVAGFAFGLILVGAASGLDLAPIGFAAIVVSFTALVNVLTALRGARKSIQWPTARAILLGMMPAMLVGVLLLDHLSTNAADDLRTLLGITILAGGILLMLRPEPYANASPAWTFSLTGALGGLTGGLFSVGGPPIVFHLYRQPVDLFRLKTTLLLVFGVSTCTRIAIVGVQGQITEEILVTSALATPLVMLATLAGKRFPPPLSDQSIKRISFLLLASMGISLILV